MLYTSFFYASLDLFAQNDVYYNAINTGSSTFITDLKSRIRSPYTRVSYDLFDETNIANFASYLISGSTRGVICVYSGYEYTYTPPFTWTVFSREHTWCQSWMPVGASSSFDQYQDQHHLFPTQQNNVNNTRSNHPLGIVSTVLSSFYDSKYGRNSSNQIVFEPRNSDKGDAARALLYMCIRYDDIGGYSWNFNWLNAFLPTVSEAPQDLNTLLQWNKDDPPDKWEVERNNYIESIQSNRNPFTDHPEYVNYIDFNNLTKLNPSYSTEPDNYLSNLTASVTDNSITLNWTDASAGNQAPSGYLIEVYDKNTYFIPIDGSIYSDDLVLDSVATVNVAFSDADTYTFSGLSNNKTYYFRVYSYNGNGSLRNYKTTGTVPYISATTSSSVLATEPSNYVTNLNVNNITTNALTLNWNDALPGTQIPSGYLLVANNTNSFSTPVDGNVYADDAVLSDGSAVLNLVYGTTQYAFSSLNQNTTYYFRMYSYNGTGSARNYKTDGTVPSVSAVTASTGSTSIAAWDFSTQTGGTNNFGTNPLTVTTKNVNVTAGDLTRGTGFGTLSGTGAASAWGSNNFTASGTLTGEITANKYYTFTITPNSNYSMSVTEIAAYNIRKSSTGTTSGQWQYKIGSGAFNNIGSPVTWGSVTTSAGNPQSAINLSGITDLQNVISGTTVTFRLVCYGASGTGGTTYFNDLGNSTSNDLIINGVVQSVLPVSLSSFNSIINRRNAELFWTTTMENNNAGFNIERVQSSESGVQSWEKIGFVSGKGTVNTSTNYSFVDKNLQTGKYKYRLKQIDMNGNYEYFNLNGEVEIGVPKKYDLSQNYPNPFNPVTKINFDLPADSKVTMLIYDITGREVAKLLNGEFKKAGYYTTDFNASSLSSGVYFYSLSTDAFRMTKKMLMIK